LDSLVEDDELRLDVKRNLRDSCAYFLSLLCVDNYSHIHWSDNYRHLNSEILDDILGKGNDNVRRSKRVKNILLSNGVIEKINYRVGKYSQGFRLTEEYNIGEFKQYKLGPTLGKRLKARGYTEENSEISDSRYNSLIEQFRKHEIGLDEERFQAFLRNLGNLLLEKFKVEKTQKIRSIKSLFNYLGRAIQIANDIKAKKFNLKIVESNGRFYSFLTSFPKLFRPFLLINGERIGEVDIKSSQPYILATVLNKEFLINNKEGYNLNTIYPELIRAINNLETINPTRGEKNTERILGLYLSKQDLEGINKYIEIDFKEDFYNHIILQGKLEAPHLIEGVKKKSNMRDLIKSKMMQFLFDRNELNREGNQVIKLVEAIYPELGKFIKQFHGFFIGNDLAILLQKAEVHLLLTVAETLNEKNPEIPFLTIHDSFITTQKNIIELEDIVKNSIELKTKKDVGIKKENLTPDIEISDQVLLKRIEKIKIKTKKNWENNRTYILKGNIKSGIEFLFVGNKEKVSYWKNKLEVNY
jgi:hypothetical protein